MYTSCPCKCNAVTVFACLARVCASLRLPELLSLQTAACKQNIRFTKSEDAISKLMLFPHVTKNIQFEKRTIAFTTRFTEKTLSRPQIYDWHREICDGRESV